MIQYEIEFWRGDNRVPDYESDEFCRLEDAHRRITECSTRDDRQSVGGGLDRMPLRGGERRRDGARSSWSCRHERPRSPDGALKQGAGVES